MKKQLFTTALVLAFAGSQGFSITNSVTISAGGLHGLALLPDGTVRAWGDNTGGDLGNGGTTPSSAPVTVTNTETPHLIMTNVQAIAAGGYHNLALLSNQTVRVWGRQHFDALGIGTTDQHYALINTNLSNIVGIAAGTYHSLALSSSGEVYGWGWDDHGQAGSTPPPSAAIPTPQLIPGLTNVMEVIAGYQHSFALQSNGVLYAWGDNSYGELGDGNNIVTNSTPQLVSISNVTNVSAGYQFSLAVSNGYVYAWGRDNYQQLGTSPSGVDKNIPSLVTDGSYYETNVVTNTVTSPETITNTVTLYTGFAPITNYPPSTFTTNTETDYMCVTNYLTSTNVTYIWTNYCVNTTYTTNITFHSMQGHVVKVAAGIYHSLALTDDGRIWAWGSNFSGCLGIGSLTPAVESAPVGVLDLNGSHYLTNVVDISLHQSEAYSMALLNDGTVVAWGDNAQGQLGNGTTTDSYLPVKTSN